MNWYYAINDRQIGPVSPEQLEGLRRTGEIHDDTLVWRDGMNAWRPLHEALALTPSPAEHRICGECRRFFPPSEVIRLNRGWICADCKPHYLQKMAEGSAPALGVGELWRDGRQLVFHSATPFPDRCIYCNASANGYRHRGSVFWAPTGRLVMASRRIEILFGLCDRHRRLRERITLAAWLTVLCGIGIFVVCFAYGDSLAFGGFFIFLVGLCFAQYAKSFVNATKIVDGVIRLRGAGKPFLASLPDWPGDR